jgi:phospholipase C
MHLPTLGNDLAVGGAKIVLTAISPFQKLFDPPGITHEFCNHQAITILRNDGFELYAQFLTMYVTELNAGVYWADKGWRNVNHYFEPSKGKGLWQFATAIETFQIYYQQGVNSMHHRNYRQAVFLLGAAAHLMQDLCVPHHARGKIFSGHKEYESWVQQQYANYAVEANSMYSEGSNLASQLLNNAVVAADLFDWVDSDRGTSKYHDATNILLPLAQRSTSGLFLKFCATSDNSICNPIAPAI